jgi:hypothetical protein
LRSPTSEAERDEVLQAEAQMRAALRLALLAVVAAGCSAWPPTEPSRPHQPPTVQQIRPSSCRVGDVVTVTGSGFTSAGNSVRIGSGYLNNVSSTNPTSLNFVLPEYLGVCPPGAQACVALALAVTPGTYKVSVINANGTSNEVALQVVEK